MSEAGKEANATTYLEAWSAIVSEGVMRIKAEKPTAAWAEGSGPAAVLSLMLASAALERHGRTAGLPSTDTFLDLAVRDTISSSLAGAARPAGRGDEEWEVQKGAWSQATDACALLLVAYARRVADAAMKVLATASIGHAYKLDAEFALIVAGAAARRARNVTTMSPVPAGLAASVAKDATVALRASTTDLETAAGLNDHVPSCADCGSWPATVCWVETTTSVLTQETRDAMAAEITRLDAEKAAAVAHGDKFEDACRLRDLSDKLKKRLAELGSTIRKATRICEPCSHKPNPHGQQEAALRAYMAACHETRKVDLSPNESLEELCKAALKLLKSREPT